MIERYNSTSSKSMHSYFGHAPESIAFGKGAYLTAEGGRRYLDCGMALGSVTLGYAHDEVDEAVIQAVRQGVNFSRPSRRERELTQQLATFFPFPVLAQYSKSGSMLLSSLIRVCRHMSGKPLVAYPEKGAYLGNNDWYLARTAQAGGIPEATREQTLLFSANSIESLADLFERHAGQLACIVMEPYRAARLSDEFYRTLRELCTRHQVFLIFDETISGLRFNYPLCQSEMQIWADFTVLGKAIANGYALAALLAPESLMLDVLSAMNTQCLYGFSNTHSGEVVGLSAAMATLRIYAEQPVFNAIESAGSRLLAALRKQLFFYGLDRVFSLEGQPGYFYMHTLDRSQDTRLRDHFYRTFHERDVLFRGTVALSQAHNAEHQSEIIGAFDQACQSFVTAS